MSEALLSYPSGHLLVQYNKENASMYKFFNSNADAYVYF